MNHLAHLVLAGPDEGLRLGAFLGDHIKGRQALHALPAGWAEGVRLHRRIDSLCDSNPDVREFIIGLEAPWRRYGGIFVDVLFDHMLARHWAEFGPCDITALAEQVNGMLERHHYRLPMRLQRFGRWAGACGLWVRYGEREMIDEIFRRLAWRHARPSPLARGLEVLDAHHDPIEKLFLSVFPAVWDQTAEWRG